MEGINPFVHLIWAVNPFVVTVCTHNFNPFLLPLVWLFAEAALTENLHVLVESEQFRHAYFDEKREPKKVSFTHRAGF